MPDGRGPGSVYLLTEGCVLHVCCDREEFFGGLDNGRETMEIVVYLEGESSEDGKPALILTVFNPLY